METIIVRRTGQAPLRVRGETVASSSSSFNNASRDYSGTPGRAEDVEIIKTATGKYVVAISHHTQWQGEHDEDLAEVFASLKDAVDFLKEEVPGWLLQRLIEQIGEEAVAEDVE
ncbi:MAG: hypothetical protein ACUVTR_02120 [Dehalococcoidia bacterium]